MAAFFLARARALEEADSRKKKPVYGFDLAYDTFKRNQIERPVILHGDGKDESEEKTKEELHLNKTDGAPTSSITEKPLQKSNSQNNLRPNIPRLTLNTVDLKTLGPTPEEAEEKERQDKLDMCDAQLSQIIAPFLFLGSKTAASNLKLLQDYKITHIINCAGNPFPNFFPLLFSYINLNLTDDPTEDLLTLFPFIITAIESVRIRPASVQDQSSPQHNIHGSRSSGSLPLNEIGPQPRFLIHCHQGVSRAATLTISYVMWLFNCTYECALARAKDKRPIVRPNYGFINQLNQWCTRIVKNRGKGQIPFLYRMAPQHQNDQFDAPVTPHKILFPWKVEDFDARFSYVIWNGSRVMVWHGSRSPHFIVRQTDQFSSNISRYLCTNWDRVPLPITLAVDIPEYLSPRTDASYASPSHALFQQLTQSGSPRNKPLTPITGYRFPTSPNSSTSQTSTSLPLTPSSNKQKQQNMVQQYQSKFHSPPTTPQQKNASENSFFAEDQINDSNSYEKFLSSVLFTVTQGDDEEHKFWRFLHEQYELAAQLPDAKAQYNARYPSQTNAQEIKEKESNDADENEIEGFGQKETNNQDQPNTSQTQDGKEDNQNSNNSSNVQIPPSPFSSIAALPSAVGSAENRSFDKDASYLTSGDIWVMPRPSAAAMLSRGGPRKAYVGQVQSENQIYGSDNNQKQSYKQTSPPKQNNFGFINQSPQIVGKSKIILIKKNQTTDNQQQQKGDKQHQVNKKEGERDVYSILDKVFK
ncbi:MAG: putative Dual specificity phosphatase [Streblomastix strix]|uniref:Putative Dual specificity phosphatase n=1 Tax=Streblomastix strix TaxID=222440 RepID=A0A5J4WGV7_9EUKA|nr:MAG: putative Dual specificity phosphatase [Streblomastix strix]